MEIKLTYPIIGWIYCRADMRGGWLTRAGFSRIVIFNNYSDARTVGPFLKSDPCCYLDKQEGETVCRVMYVEQTFGVKGKFGGTFVWSSHCTFGRLAIPLLDRIEEDEDGTFRNAYESLGKARR